MTKRSPTLAWLLGAGALALAGASVVLAQARLRIDSKNVLHLEQARPGQTYLVLRQGAAAEQQWIRPDGAAAALQLSGPLRAGERITVYALEPTASCGPDGCKQCQPKDCPVPSSPPPFADPAPRPTGVPRTPGIR